MDCKRVVIVLLTAVLVAGCKPTVTGSGNVVTRKLDLKGFTKVEAGHAFNLEIGRAKTFGVEIRIDDNLVQYLQVTRQGDELRIGMDSSHNYSVGDDSMVALVGMPELTGLDLHGASKASLSGFQSSKDLRIEMSGASELKGEIRTGDLDLDLSGASDLALKGSGGKATLELSGASDADLSGFSLAEAAVDLSGASEATVNVAGRLAVKASGASTLVYLGDPELGPITTSGASSVKAR